MKWSRGGKYGTPYKVGHAVGFLVDISIMDRKGEIRVKCNTNIVLMRNKCKNQVTNAVFGAESLDRKLKCILSLLYARR